MIVLATFTLNFLHPGMLLGNGKTWLSPKTRSNDSMSVNTVTENIGPVPMKEAKTEA